MTAATARRGVVEAGGKPGGSDRVGRGRGDDLEQVGRGPTLRHRREEQRVELGQRPPRLRGGQLHAAPVAEVP